MQDGSGKTGPDERHGRTAECPDPSVWYEIAGGVSSPDESHRWLEHVAGCDYCRPLLHESVSDFNDETTPAEERQLADLESASPAWQQNLVQQITGNITIDRARITWWRKANVALLVAVAAMLVVVVILGYRMFLPANPQRQANKLLASAYTQKRTLKFRMEGMPYTPAGEGMQRQAETSFLSRPEALLQAELLISKQLATNPSDVFWLQAKARADLMEGKYDGAVQSLQHALQISPKSPDIMIDLATAYSATGKYDSAYEILSNVLALRPNDPLALFNRAIVGEQLHLYHQALDDAEGYLKLDPRSKWADEAQALANSIRERLKKHDQSRAAPLLTPAQIVALGNDPGLANGVNERIEQYLYEAVVHWLPQSYPARGNAPDVAAQRALFFLADLTREKHNDLWLSDLIRGSASPHFPDAIEALAHSVQANNDGDYNVAATQANQSERLFQSANNAAGVLRSRFEHVFAAQMKRESASCAQQAGSTIRQAERFSYPWLQVQLGLERGVCSALMGALGGDKADSARAMERADRNGYGGLYLRALFFLSDDQMEEGQITAGSKSASLGLETYWSGVFPPTRGYSFYTAQSYGAQIAHRPYMQYALLREAVALSDFDPDALIRAMAHRALAEAAAAVDNADVAARNYTEASRLFAMAPRTEANKNSALETQIQSAQIEIRLGRLDAAEHRLVSVQDEIRSLSNDFLVKMFYSAMGELQLKRQRYAEAEQALYPALKLAERNLESLHTESERASWVTSAEPMYLGLSESKLMQGRSEEALQAFELYLGASFREHGIGKPGTFFAETMTNRPSCLSSRVAQSPPATLLAYGQLPEGLAIWVCDERGISLHWSAEEHHNLDELAERFRDLISDPASDLKAVRRDARSLYSVLIAPVQDKLLPGRTLVIETQGSLEQVPFQALVDSRGHYLIENRAIVYSRGEQSEARLHATRPVSADSSALIVGSSSASSPGEGLLSLPDVAAEADAVAAKFRTPTLLKGDDVSLVRIGNELSSASIFHFAGHSLSTPERSGLLLAGLDQNNRPSLLDAAALQRLRLPNLQIAVLSACSTASGSSGADGFESVTEAFLRHGVPHVVASQWAVDSVPSRAYVEDFFTSLFSGQSVSEAVRVASTRMLSDSRTVHPYYWAAFSSYGRP